MTPRKSWLTLLGLIVAGTAVAQSTSSAHVTIEHGPVVDDRSHELVRIISQLDSTKLRTVIPATVEAGIIESAREVAQLTLKRDLREPDGYFTVTTDEGDVLAARWTGTPPESAIWLWDTPSTTVFLFQSDPATLSRAVLPQYCEQLLIWDQYPVKLASLKLSFQASFGPDQYVMGRGDHAIQEMGMFYWWSGGLIRGGKADFAVGMSKPFFGNRYKPEALIPERFPPLASRLHNLEKQELFGELGKGYLPTRLTSYPTDRDGFVMAELLSRGPLTDIELEQVVVGPFAENRFVLNSRLQSFIRVAEKRGDLAIYAPTLGRLYLLDKNGAFWDISFSALSGAMKKNGIDFSAAALAFLERNRYVRPILFYLERNSQNDEEALRILERLQVRPDLRSEVESTIRVIRRRVQPAAQQ